MRRHRAVPDSLRRIIRQLPANPAAIYDPSWSPIIWNSMWVTVFGDPNQRPERERNKVWRYFTGLPTRVVRSAEEERMFEKRIVSDLRSSFGQYPDDEHLAQLITDLLAASPGLQSSGRHVRSLPTTRSTRPSSIPTSDSSGSTATSSGTTVFALSSSPPSREPRQRRPSSQRRPWSRPRIRAAIDSASPRRQEVLPAPCFGHMTSGTDDCRVLRALAARAGGGHPRSWGVVGATA